LLANDQAQYQPEDHAAQTTTADHHAPPAADQHTRHRHVPSFEAAATARAGRFRLAGASFVLPEPRFNPAVELGGRNQK